MSPLLMVLSAIAVDVVGTSVCPAPADVAAALARVSVAGDAANETPDWIAEIGGPSESLSAGARMSITLRTRQGAVLAERVVADSGSCADLAEAAAVVIAVWQGVLSPNLGPELPHAPAPALLTPVIVAERVAEKTAPGRLPVEFGVAALASAAGRDVSPGLQVDSTVGALTWGLAPRLVGSIEAPHELTLESGRALWARSTLGLGIRKRSHVGAFAVDAQAHANGAFVRVRGAGFDDNYTRTGLDLGMGWGVQLAWPQHRFAPFLGLGAAVWVGHKAVEALGTTAVVALPRFDAWLAIGVSVGRFR